MSRIKTKRRSTFCALALSVGILLLLSCRKNKNSKSQVAILVDTTTIDVLDVVQKFETKKSTKNKYPVTILISDKLQALESEYQEMLEPISDLKESDPKMFWFIVSWLKTNYKTPNWKGYGEPDWKQKAKQRGIDCSGFARIMQDKIFRYDIKGGSRGILKKYCETVSQDDITMGDLVFFQAPYSKSGRITHMGVYLKDGYFVHATSKRSAAAGFGLRIDSLTSERWDDELVAVGRVKEEYRSENTSK